MRTATLLGVFLLAACTPGEDVRGPLTEKVVVPLYTEYCAPQYEEIPEEVRVVANTEPILAWEPLCFRDGALPDYFNLKFAWADDRTDDFWEVWYIRKSATEIRFGSKDVPGSDVEINLNYPRAETRVLPRPLTEGEYVLRIDAISGEVAQFDPENFIPELGSLNVTSGEVWIHAVPDGEE